MAATHRQFAWGCATDVQRRTTWPVLQEEPNLDSQAARQRNSGLPTT